MKLPQLGTPLSQEHIDFLYAFAKACRASAVEMVVNADSGHPGGSLSCIDYLSVLYTFILSQTGEKIVISNGHISPGVYSVLAEMGYIDKEKVVHGFRKAGSIFEGHVTRHVAGVWYGTGPLGTGISAASGFAVTARLRAAHEREKANRVFGLFGDGEAQEGQVYEMSNFAGKYKLDRFIAFVDANRVQLSDSLQKIMPLNVKAHFEAAGWKVMEVNGHDFQDIWRVLGEADAHTGSPVLLLGHTIMGFGGGPIEKDGREDKATWHGKSPGEELGKEVLAFLQLTSQEDARIDAFKLLIKWRPEKPIFTPHGTLIRVDTGVSIEYAAEVKTDCRSAYGSALKDLGERNKQVLVFDADLVESVKTGAFEKACPERFFECGIAEQHMVSCAGGASLDGFIPFASTFGAFMTSRAKDQARVNDINNTNVKMVATHCGLSVGEDGPTHQAIDDMGSLRGFFNTVVLEPADPNHTDRIIRYIASHYGNFYVRMGRHKVPVLTKEDGSVFYDAKYQFVPGKFDLLRKGSQVTLIVSGPMVCKALKVREELGKKVSVEIIIAHSPTRLDEKLLIASAKKTGRVITLEDHNPYTGIGSQIAAFFMEEGVNVKFHRMGVTAYQLSGQPEELYENAGIGNVDIVKAILKIMKK